MQYTKFVDNKDYMQSHNYVTTVLVQG